MEIFTLLILFQIKHFLADYPLQTPYMLQKFKYSGWILPLSAHSGVHAIGTLAIAIAFNPKVAAAVTLFDFVVHFIMDRIKASPSLLGRFKALSGDEFRSLSFEPPMFVSHSSKRSVMITVTKGEAARLKNANQFFWWSLGLDQMVHHLTHYAIIYTILN